MLFYDNCYVFMWHTFWIQAMFHNKLVLLLQRSTYVQNEHVQVITIGQWQIKISSVILMFFCLKACWTEEAFMYRDEGNSNESKLTKH